MALSSKTNLGSGFILGSWGAAQAIGAGLGIAVGGILRDVVNKIALSGYLGSTFENNSMRLYFCIPLGNFIHFYNFDCSWDAFTRNK